MNATSSGLLSADTNLAPTPNPDTPLISRTADNTGLSQTNQEMIGSTHR